MSDPSAQLNYIRIAPRKMRLVANLVKGMDVSRAETQLRFLTKRASHPLIKLLRSAVANAKHNFQLEEKDLFVQKITVDGGPMLKRFRARAFGRAARIRKRTSHITITLSQRKNNLYDTSSASIYISNRKDNAMEIALV